MTKVWITSLDRDQAQVQAIMRSLQQYGLNPDGHFWTDDLKNTGWLAPKDSIVDKDNALWVLLGSQKSLEADTVRFGLALLALSVQAQKGHGFPLLFVDTKGDLNIDSLPTPLRGTDLISLESPSMAAKIVAKANTPVKEIDTEYRLDIHAHASFGLWFEIGPTKEKEWNGALLGAHGAEVDFHGVGSAGKLPEKAVLEYPMKGLKLQLGEREYTAWAVQNTLDERNSYYVRIQGMPGSIVFGPYAAEEETSVNVIDLC